MGGNRSGQARGWRRRIRIAAAVSAVASVWIFFGAMFLWYYPHSHIYVWGNWDVTPVGSMLSARVIGRINVAQLVLLATLVLPAIWVMVWAVWLVQMRLLQRRIVSGFCDTCRYDLTGQVSARCPECGTEKGDGLERLNRDSPVPTKRAFQAFLIVTEVGVVLLIVLHWLSRRP